MSGAVKRYVADARTPHELWVMYLHEVRVTTKTSRADPQSTKAVCDLGLLLYSTNVRDNPTAGSARSCLPASPSRRFSCYSKAQNNTHVHKP